MLKRTKAMSLILAIAMLAGMAVGCGSKSGQDGAKGSENQNAGGNGQTQTSTFPLTDKPVTLTMMVSLNAQQSDFSTLPIWKEYEKKTNVHIEWIQVNSQNLTEKRNIALATGDVPDAFLKCGLSEVDLLKYGQQGTFISLNKLLESSAPNFNKILNDRQNYPDVKKDLTMADGNIYSLPYVKQSDFFAISVSPKLFINKVWLDKTGKKMPVTTDDLYDVFKAFKEKDPNGNKAQDEVPWCSDIDSVLASLKGAWGLQNRGSRQTMIDYDEKEKKLRFIPTDPNYREMLQYASKLYKEGLIDQEAFTLGLTEIASRGSQDQVGAFSLVGNTYVGPEHQNDFEGIATALKGPHGDQLWSCILTPVLAKGTFAITNRNKYPELTMKWVDYFYSEDGMKLYFMGIEGESYRVNAQGEYEYTDNIMKNPDGLNFNQAVSKYVPYAGQSNPALLSPKYFKGVETQPIPLEASKRMQPYFVKEVWNTFNYTAEENSVMTSVGNDINSYVKEMTASFITGKTPFGEWDNYVNTLKKMGLDQYMKTQQTAYERYIKN